nr:hypothetical protein GCM10020063_003190 [Dactylosporangium thailandense]
MHGLDLRRELPRWQPDDRDQALDARALVEMRAVRSLLEQFPFLAAGAAQEVRRGIEREKAGTVGDRVHQGLRPVLARLDVVVVQEADLDVVPDARVRAHLVAEVVVELSDEHVVRAAGVAEKKIQHTSSAGMTKPTPKAFSI